MVLNGFSKILCAPRLYSVNGVLVQTDRGEVTTETTGCGYTTTGVELSVTQEVPSPATHTEIGLFDSHMFLQSGYCIYQAPSVSIFTQVEAPLKTYFTMYN